jgi:hypothetical protein
MIAVLLEACMDRGYLRADPYTALTRGQPQAPDNPRLDDSNGYAETARRPRERATTHYAVCAGENLA